MEEHEIKVLKRRNVILLVLLVALILFIFSCICLFKLGVFTTKKAKITGSSVVTSDSSNTEQLNVTYPGYSMTYNISEEKKCLPLLNYDSNSVNIVYELDYSGNNILTTDELKPGDSIDVDLYEFFEKPGEYDIDIRACAKVPNVGDGTVTNFKLHVVREGR